MDISLFTLAEFLGKTPDTVPPSPIIPENLLIPAGEVHNYPVLATANGFEIVKLNETDVAAVDSHGNEAGFYSSTSLIVHGPYQGRGLATALALHAHTLRSSLPESRSLSDGGKKALTSAWNVAKGNKTNPWWP